MKIAEGLKLIQEEWVRKPKGFRVKFHKQTEDGLETTFSPPQGIAPLNSDVTAWRYAWKLWQASKEASESGEPGAFFNITVVDDLDQPFRFYGSGEYEVYSPKSIDQEV